MSVRMSAIYQYFSKGDRYINRRIKDEIKI